MTVETNIPPISGYESTIAYRIQPDHVFDSPQRVWLPIPDGWNADDLTVMYYKGSAPNQGWHKATDITGFLLDSEPIIVNGYVGSLVNHAGIIALRKN